MDKKRSVVKHTGKLLAVSALEIILGSVGFATNFYTLFYGALSVSNTFPLFQVLTFTVTLLGFVLQLLSGAYRALACLLLRQGHEDTPLDMVHVRDSDLRLTIFQGVYATCLLVVWLCSVAMQADKLIPAMDVGAATHRVLQDDPIGHLILLCLVLSLFAGMDVTVVAGRLCQRIADGLQKPRLQTIAIQQQQPETLPSA
ncbi:uncharacterized protein LOC129596119 [Paramacrobiotus metropolitanus]|uniref:uncharacterized protein LOC129596119 n=1 Tax=Paramacrobiotus metropolitanus TaxID=2943436 RepID=UPI002445BEEE|nr:uncharacterized protein LOC129596119 [Paramacrobiotus metropolitanus]XP_055349283.1 uncharacterized protein LOC129596119 [Paramacrobiotus metropolitanus]XP_055349284.1 uncharacterized protein LOC129596119 [Paramacrobiotus metropolitanus]XP_055349285.1 uncharacterized protein LOC129596119 [Paramacrobiotus metropolitanus]